MTISLTPAAAIEQFQDFFLLEKEGKQLLGGTCLERHGVPNSYIWEYIGGDNAALMPQRGAFQSALPASDVGHRNVQIVTTPFADLLPTDITQVATTPPERQALAALAGTALGRSQDELKLRAMDVSTTATNNIIGLGSGTAFTFQKLQEGVEKLKEVNSPMDDIYLAWTPGAERQLMADPQVSSSDFNTARVLVQGAIDSYYGVKFKTFGERVGGGIPTVGAPGSTIRRALLWTMPSMGAAYSIDPTVESERRIEFMSWITVYFMRLGVGVLEERCVWAIEYDDAL